MGPCSILSCGATARVLPFICCRNMIRACRRYQKHEYMMGAGSAEGKDTQIVDGIVQGHGYSILEVRRVEDDELIRLRNPWGFQEWEGEYSDKWLRSHGRRIRTILGWVDDQDDGTFWMPFSDFVTHFSQVYVCRIFDMTWSTQVYTALSMRIH